MDRIKDIDVAKGIGIILVVLGHNIPVESRLFNYIALFHMPLFFMLAGYFFNLHGEGFNKFIKKLSFRLLIPYAVFTVLIYPLFAMKYSDLTNGIKEAVLSIRGQIIYNHPIWFLTALFVVQVIYYFVKKMDQE